MEKICVKCGVEKLIGDFPKDKYNKTGYSPYCKPCKREKVKSNYYKNPSKKIEKTKQWSKENPDKTKQYYNKQKEKGYIKQWYLDNKAKVNESSKKYTQNKRNNEGVYYSKNGWVKVKPKLTPEVRKLMNVYRDRVKKGIQTNRQKTFELLGCSFPELKLHIESQFYPEMSWDNWGLVWELDHIKGCINFDFNIPGELEKCFHYTNLRPLFKTTKIAQSFGYNNIEGNRNRKRYH